jgi:hypothetical protein
MSLKLISTKGRYNSKHWWVYDDLNPAATRVSIGPREMAEEYIERRKNKMRLVQSMESMDDNSVWYVVQGDTVKRRGTKRECEMYIRGYHRSMRWVCWLLGHRRLARRLSNGRECQCCGRFQSFDPFHGYTGPWITEGEALEKWFVENGHGHRI